MDESNIKAFIIRILITLFIGYIFKNTPLAGVISDFVGDIVTQTKDTKPNVVTDEHRRQVQKQSIIEQQQRRLNESERKHAEEQSLQVHEQHSIIEQQQKQLEESQRKRAEADAQLQQVQEQQYIIKQQQKQIEESRRQQHLVEEQKKAKEDIGDRLKSTQTKKEKQAICRYCNGYGFVECARCKAKGIIRCADCMGKGCKYCKWDGISRKCPDCNSQGRFSCPYLHR